MSAEKNFVSQLMTAIATYMVDLHFYISHFLLQSTVSKLAKAPGFNLGKKLSNFLGNHEGLN